MLTVAPGAAARRHCRRGQRDDDAASRALGSLSRCAAQRAASPITRSSAADPGRGPSSVIVGWVRNIRLVSPSSRATGRRCSGAEARAVEGLFEIDFGTAAVEHGHAERVHLSDDPVAVPAVGASPPAGHRRRSGKKRGPTPSARQRRPQRLREAAPATVAEAVGIAGPRRGPFGHAGRSWMRPIAACISSIRQLVPKLSCSQRKPGGCSRS